jgi:DNA-binding CsgD family transcriptional regulator
VEKHIEKQQSFLSVLTKSQAYIRGDYFNFSKLVTKELSRLFNFKRVSIWLFKEDASELQCISLYQNNKYMPPINLKSELYPQYLTLLKTNRTLASNDVSKSKDLHNLYDDYFSPNKIVGVLDTAIKDGEAIIGALRLEIIDKNKKWENKDFNISSLTAAIIGCCFTLNKRIESDQELLIIKTHLKESNITLKNVLDRFEIEKKSYNENVAINIERNINPLISQLKSDAVSDQDVLKRLEIGISNLSSNFYKRLVKVNYNLTPTEVKICQMIKGGYQGKEIAGILKLSFSTVETHKKNIRRKLDITGKAINLRVYLNEIESY